PDRLLQRLRIRVFRPDRLRLALERSEFALQLPEGFLFPVAPNHRCRVEVGLGGSPAPWRRRPPEPRAAQVAGVGVSDPLPLAGERRAWFAILLSRER